VADVNAFVDAYAHAWCDGLASCCHFWPFHQDVCLESARTLARDGIALSAGPSLELPHLNPSVRDACLAQIRQVVAACPEMGYPETPAPACQWVFSKGTTPVGGACKGDDDCLPSPDHGPMCVNDVCSEPRTNLQLGEACSVSTSCAPTLACERVNFTCAPKIAIGKSCALDIDCVQGAYCDAQCTAYKALGEACQAIVSCGTAAYCDSTYKCSAFTTTGGACTTSSTCVAEDYCSPSTKVCTPRVPIGQPCPYQPTGNDEPCAYGGWCSHTSGTLLKGSDTTPLVCVPKNLPLLCFTG
jgi:hypothetical protein